MDAPFSERHRLLTALIDPEVHTTLEIVSTYIVNNEEEMKAKHIQFIALGYEGTMVRHSDESYAVNKRSSQLLKYKDFIDEVFTVVDIVPSESRPEQGVVVCTSPKGTFSCGMKFSHFDRKVMLLEKEKYIGQPAEVRFFEYTDGGIPRFPVCVGFRLDK
jgi:ATP-dependent DNA ligase